MDLNRIREAFVGPGMDTRQWVSYGLVMPDTPDGRSVSFDDTLGPLVKVTLQPSGTDVVCRVAMGIAGDLEGEYFPFVGGDEVLVVLPSGSEAGAPVIIARLSNGIDKFPKKVAGMDTTKNNIAFKRLRTPYVVESANGILFRHAGTGAQFGLDQSGQVIMNDASGARFFYGADAQGFTSADGNTSMQLLANSNQLAFNAGDGVQTTNLVMGPAEFSVLTSGQVKMGSAGLQAIGHGLTAEQVISLIYQTLTAVGIIGGPVAEAAILTAIALTATNPLPATLANAFAATLTVPPDPTGQKTGFGRAGFLL
jgi:hypothetical protein